MQKQQQNMQFIDFTFPFQQAPSQRSPQAQTVTMQQMPHDFSTTNATTPTTTNAANTTNTTTATTTTTNATTTIAPATTATTIFQFHCAPATASSPLPQKNNNNIIIHK